MDRIPIRSKGKFINFLFTIFIEKNVAKIRNIQECLRGWSGVGFFSYLFIFSLLGLPKKTSDIGTPLESLEWVAFGSPQGIEKIHPMKNPISNHV